MSSINFETSNTEIVILNPFKEFSEEVHTVEIRKDPLLGSISAYNPRLKDKVKFFFGNSDEALVSSMVEETAKSCIFCGERLEQNTPQYPPSLVPDGRIRVGDAVLFPNLFPIGKYHSVIVLSEAHFLKLSEFTPDVIDNGLQAARKFVDLIYKWDTAPLFIAINANYLFPAGATLAHPHLQMLVSSVAYSYHERLIDAGRVYNIKNGSSYFLDLIKEEKRIGARYIINKGKWHWIAAFSPMGINEIMAIHEDEYDFGRLSAEDLNDLSYGISKVLRLYERLGHLSFNYSILAARMERSEGFRCLVKIISRQNPYRNYRNDDYFFQKLLHSELIINLPEDLASDLRNNF